MCVCVWLGWNISLPVLTSKIQSLQHNHEQFCWKSLGSYADLPNVRGKGRRNVSRWGSTYEEVVSWTKSCQIVELTQNPHSTGCFTLILLLPLKNPTSPMISESRAYLNIKMSSYQYMDSHYKDENVFIMEIADLERPSLYWDGTHLHWRVFSIRMCRDAMFRNVTSLCIHRDPLELD